MDSDSYEITRGRIWDDCVIAWTWGRAPSDDDLEQTQARLLDECEGPGWMPRGVAGPEIGIARRSHTYRFSYRRLSDSIARCSEQRIRLRIGGIEFCPLGNTCPVERLRELDREAWGAAHRPPPIPVDGAT